MIKVGCTLPGEEMKQCHDDEEQLALLLCDDDDSLQESRVYLFGQWT